MTGPNPTDRGKLGTKRHVLTDGQGIPICCYNGGQHPRYEGCYKHAE
jgi:hypothetical protein